MNEPMCDEQGNSYIKIICPNGETVYCPKNKHKQVKDDLANGIYPRVSPDNIVVALGQIKQDFGVKQ